MTRRLAICVALCALLFGADAAAYVTMKSSSTGVELRWTSLPMKFNIDQVTPPGVTSTDQRNAVKAAYQAWSNVSCSYYASSDLGIVSKPWGDKQDSINTNVWTPSWPSNYGQSALGITWTSYDPSSGKIFDADTHYNPNYSWSTAGSAYKIDVQSVATHEIGHQLGMDHSQYQDATMFYATGQGDTSQRSLHSDDIAGICHLYPSGQPPPPECTTSVQCAPSETCSGGKCVNAVQKGYGASCTSDKDCTSGMCLSDGTNTFCSQTCSSTATCPNGDKCVPLTGGGSACLPGSASMGTKLLGQPCQSNLDCKSDICVSIPGSGYLCSQKCVLTSDNCPTNYYCVNSSAGGLCIPGQKQQPPPPPPPPPTKELGDPCGTHSECKTKLCAQYCIKWCDANDTSSCPTGWECKPVAGGQTACFKSGTKPPPVTPQPGEFGAVCTLHSECNSGICASIGDASFCTKYCSAGPDCGEGYDCLAAGDKQVCGPYTASDTGSGCAVGREYAASGGDRDDGGAPHWPLLPLLLPLVILLRRRFV